MLEIGLTYYGQTTIGNTTYYRIRAVYFPTDAAANTLIQLLERLTLPANFDFGEFLNIERAAPETILQGTEILNFHTNTIFAMPETVHLAVLWDAPYAPTLGPYTAQDLFGRSPELLYCVDMWQDIPTGERPYEIEANALPAGEYIHIPLTGWQYVKNYIASTWKGAAPQDGGYSPQWIGLYGGLIDATDNPRIHVADPLFHSDDTLGWVYSIEIDTQYIEQFSISYRQDSISCDTRFLWADDYQNIDNYDGFRGSWRVGYGVGTASESAWVWVYRQVLSPVVVFPHLRPIAPQTGGKPPWMSIPGHDFLGASFLPEIVHGAGAEEDFTVNDVPLSINGDTLQVK